MSLYFAAEVSQMSEHIKHMKYSMCSVTVTLKAGGSLSFTLLSAAL